MGKNQSYSEFHPEKSELLKDTPPPLPPYVSGKNEKNEGEIKHIKAVTEVNGELQFAELSSNPDEMQAQFDDLFDHIEKKLEQIYQITGWTPDSIKDLLSNPNNFDQESWSFIQKTRESLLQRIEQPKKTKSNAPLNDRLNLPQAKGRRNKSTGARRNWIPLR